MRIVHYFAGRVNPEKAKVGSVHVLYYLSRAQKADGHEVDWYLVPRKSEYENRGHGFGIFDYGKAKLFGLLPPLAVFAKFIRERKSINLVHLHGPFTQENILISLCLFLLGIPYVISSHGSFSPGAMKGKYLLKLIYKYFFALPICNSAKLVHVHTESDLQEARNFGVTVSCVVAEHGSDHISEKFSEKIKTELTPPIEINPEKFNLLFLGRLDPWHKGLDILIEAISALNNKDVNLFLIGPPKSRYKGVLEELVNRLELCDQVKILPPVYDLVKKINWYSSVDLFVHPSRFDVFPIAIYEALAAGCPVMVTPGSQADDFVTDNKVGVVVDLNINSITNHLKSLFIEKERLILYKYNSISAIGERTWKRTWEKMLTKL